MRRLSNWSCRRRLPSWNITLSDMALLPGTYRSVAASSRARSAASCNVVSWPGGAMRTASSRLAVWRHSSARPRAAVGADLVDAPVELEVMAVGIEELDRDLAAGAAAAFVGDLGAVRLQVIAGAEHLVERRELEGEMMQALAVGRRPCRRPAPGNDGRRCSAGTPCRPASSSRDRCRRPGSPAPRCRTASIARGPRRRSRRGRFSGRRRGCSWVSIMPPIRQQGGRTHGEIAQHIVGQRGRPAHGRQAAEGARSGRGLPRPHRGARGPGPCLGGARRRGRAQAGRHARQARQAGRAAARHSARGEGHHRHQGDAHRPAARRSIATAWRARMPPA